jgi:hypothetical protein
VLCFILHHCGVCHDDTPRSSGFARLASGTFLYKAINLNA